MRAKEFINENVPATRTDTEREEAQTAYMQGQCMILAIAINQLNPKRYPIGYIWEYNADAGVPDMQLDDDEWEDLSPQEQEEISNIYNLFSMEDILMQQILLSSYSTNNN